MPAVRAITSAGQVVIGSEEAVVLPAGDTLLALEDAPVSEVRLNGLLRGTQAVGGMRLLSVDLTRSTGFHHLHVPPGHHFWFGTEDAKLRLDGIERMLAFMRSEALGWSGQLLFSDGAEYRDPHVVYGWLDRHADDALGAAQAISMRPYRQLSAVPKVTPRGGRKLVMRRTMTLLRRRPELLESSLDGPIRVGGKHYRPLKVVALHRTQSLVTTANARVVWLVAQISSLAAEVVSQIDDDQAAQRCREWIQAAQVLLLVSPLSVLYPQAAWRPPAPVPTPEETHDPRYIRTYSLASAVVPFAGWLPSREVRPLYAFVDRSDEIFQAFVAAVVGASLRLTKRDHQPLYDGHEWEMFVGVAPPPSVIRSWRSYTDTPADYRPDFVLRRLADDFVVIADAKYRNDGERSSESSRKELMSYMAAFGVKRAIVFFPPDPPSALMVHRVGFGDHQLAEVTVSPVEGIQDFLGHELPAVLAETAAPPPWRG